MQHSCVAWGPARVPAATWPRGRKADGMPDCPVSRAKLVLSLSKGVPAPHPWIYRKRFNAKAIARGAVRCTNSINFNNRSCAAWSRVVSLTVCREPEVPRPVRRRTRFVADQIRRSEFARAVTARAPWRRNLPDDRFRGTRFSSEPAPYRC